MFLLADAYIRKPENGYSAPICEIPTKQQDDFCA
jgi:hypothetical protein